MMVSPLGHQGGACHEPERFDEVREHELTVQLPVAHLPARERSKRVAQLAGAQDGGRLAHAHLLFRFAPQP